MELMERRRILLNTPHIDIVTGIQFVTDMVAPLESLVINFSPIQDLHGYDSPWPAGGGANLFNPLLVGDYTRYVINDDETITVTGTDGRAWVNVATIPLSAGTYTVKIYGHRRSQMRTSEDDYMSDINLQNSAYTFTLSADGGIKLKLGLGDTYPITIYVQIESGSSATDWTPYSNICPITGWTGMNVTRTGKNLFNKNTAEIGKWLSVDTGLEASTSTGYALSDYIPVDAGTTYTMTNPYSSRRWLYDANKNPLSKIDSLTFTPTVDGYARITIALNSTSLDQMQIEEGSTATSYEPYTSETYSIDWTDEAGTVYSGNVDFSTGVLTVTHLGVDMGSLSWSAWQADTNIKLFLAQLEGKKELRSSECISSCYTYNASITNWSNLQNCQMTGNTNNRIYIRDDEYSTADNFKTAVTGQKIVYELATPTTVQLTPEQVLALKGTNNLSLSSQIKFWTHRDIS